METSRLTRDVTAEPISRDRILRREQRQRHVNFPCSADHEQDWQPYPVDPYSCYMCDYTYNPLLLGTVNDTKYLAASAMDFAPCMWLGPLFDSGNRFGAVISESTLASAAFDCSEFPHVNKIEYPPAVSADVERS